MGVILLIELQPKNKFVIELQPKKINHYHRAKALLRTSGTRAKVLLRTLFRGLKPYYEPTRCPASHAL